MTDIPVGMNRDFNGKLKSRFNINDYSFVPIVGLGVKTSTPYYDDFESRSLGAPPNPMGDLTISNLSGRTITTNSHSGSRVLECAYTGGISSPGRFPKAYLTLSERSNKVYFCCWFKFSGGSSGGSNVWKFLRFNNTSGSDPYVDSNKFSHEMTSGDGVGTPASHSESIMVDGAYTTTAVDQIPADDTLPNLFPNNQWFFYEAYIDAGTVGNLDAQIIVKSNNKVALNFTNRNYLSATNPLGVRFVLTPMNGFDNATTSTLISYMDEIYVDNSLARCVMTDSATYSTSTAGTRCVQVLSATTAEGAYLIKKRGLFTEGQTAYYHFWDVNGAYVGNVAGVAV